MLTIKENESCPYALTCNYNLNNSCAGAFPRRTTFTCSYVDNGRITESGSIRNPLDITGKMTILTEVSEMK